MQVSGKTEDIDNAINKAKNNGLSRNEYLEIATYLESVSINMQVSSASARKTQINEARNAALRKAEELKAVPVIKKQWYEKPSGIILLGVAASLIAALIWWCLNIPNKT